jgi:alpha-tubulin suppressor-like RCC1 family protein
MHRLMNGIRFSAARGRVVASLLAAMVLISAFGATTAMAAAGPGSVLAWGYNGNGQLGDGSMTNASAPTAPSAGAIPAGTTIVQTAVGYSFSLALGSNGDLYAWGGNGSGELGDGTTVETSVPVAVTMPAGTTFTQIAAGADFGLALGTNGKLYAWGANDSGQLGNGTTTNSLVPVPVSAGAIPAGATITQFAAGYADAALLSASGKVYTWGYGSDGALGDGSTSNSPVPVAVSAGAIPAGTTITAISAGDASTFALGANGKLYAWGENNSGDLGNGTTTNSTVPVAVSQGALPTGTTITQVAAGYGQSVALGSNGKLYAWGPNGNGQLGNGSTTDSLVPSPVSQGPIPTGATITQLSAGRQQTFASTAAGEVYAWGDNSFGGLGDGGAEAQSDVPVAVSLPAGTTVETLARGADAAHLLAVAGDLAIATATLPSGTVGVPYATNLTATGGQGAEQWSADGLPAGLAIDSANGQISGTPTSAGTASVAVTVSDANGLLATATLPITIAAAPGSSGSSGSGSAPVPPAPSSAFSITSHRIASSRAIAVGIGTRAPGRLVVRATYSEPVRQKSGRHRHTHRTSTYATATIEVGASDQATVTLTPTKAARAALIAHHGLKVKVTLTFLASGGNAGATQALQLTIPAPRHGGRKS